ncbi:Calcineurin-like metallo-phosphoesterase superfamily protein [Arabidopsis thaliana]|uniref:Calcineurin-like metallo-phosphoesterase superfamily protein n=1 Tax=Arabidopsis thaliana TaxID=3702 RepID=F4HNW0_ARATH|nr:Calcineurin-like metallo-phosphoesterase superfamily protein [Arabidopsis thaliana]AEE28067.1 Calcineurin-like metallo-phosphoesterase superfamily protein [Arabidopsis thaliana]|eukprot:NP_001154316.1 Calcineurin-like metallo-phosphoesterase superfamily protein [Arabidopsis thaliana]
MASLYLNSLLPLPPSHPQKLLEPSSSSLLSTSNGNELALKPIVINGDPPTFVSAPARRIVAGFGFGYALTVGDLHGDLGKARDALQLAGVLSSDGRDQWYLLEFNITHLEVGDILDRGDDEIAILSLLRSLDDQAKANGGAVFQVNGNHETMNVEGDFRYVDARAFDECTDFLDYLEDYAQDWDKAFRNWIFESRQWKEDRRSSQTYWDQWNVVKRQKGVIARSVLLRPGGRLACELSRHGVILRVNNWLFCHGGLLPHHVAYGIERINREVSTWMRSPTNYEDSPQMPFIATRGYDSVVWSRLYSRETSELEDYQIEQVNKILHDTLEAVGAKAMVVGHTPQLSGVNCEYGCGIWRVDVGMSSGVLDSRPEVLEIRGDKARVIRSNRDRLHELQVADYI